ncbi:hypothetical protein [Coraliomargarita parva]|uniref:hypothetical protein n=1 Tax=Coraliomargarita parva TaxID=3014050 RepID=UPI0022B3D285|nr:hypothetical protein [Coraliomargarita parva]
MQKTIRASLVSGCLLSTACWFSGCGAQQADEPDPVSDSHTQIEGSVTKSASSNSFGSTWQHNDATYLETDTIYLMAADGEVLTQAVIGQLAPKLASIPGVSQVQTTSDESWPAPGQLLPDMCFFIGLESVEDSSSLMKLERKSVLHMSGGSGVFAPRFSFTDHMTPPSMKWDMEGTVRHELSYEGLRIKVNIDDLTADALAKELDKAIREKLDAMRKVVSAPIPLPDYFTPDYREQALPAALQARQPKALLAGHRPFVPYESYWNFSVAEDEVEPLAAMEGQLEAEGWKIKYSESESNHLPGLRATRKQSTEIIEIWPVDDQTPLSFNLRHRLRLSQPEIFALIDRAFESDAPAGLLAHFYHNWSRDHWKHFVQIVETKGQVGSKLSAWVLMEAYTNAGHKEEALALLDLVYLLGRIDNSQTDSRLAERGKKLNGQPDWAPAFPNESSLETWGIPTLEIGQDIAVRTLAPGRYALFAASGGNQEEELIFFRIQDLGDDQYSVSSGRVALRHSSRSDQHFRSECSRRQPVISTKTVNDRQTIFRCYKDPEKDGQYKLEAEVRSYPEAVQAQASEHAGNS